MSVEIIVVAGAWGMAIATTLTKNIRGWFMILSYIAALVISYNCLS